MSTLYVAFKGNVRIDCVAQRGDVCLYSDVDYNSIAMNLSQNGIFTNIGNTPTQYLCNEAYWYMLKKFNCHVIFFHVPSIKYITENFIEKISSVLLLHVI